MKMINDSDYPSRLLIPILSDDTSPSSALPEFHRSFVLPCRPSTIFQMDHNHAEENRIILLPHNLVGGLSPRNIFDISLPCAQNVCFTPHTEPAHVDAPTSLPPPPKRCTTPLSVFSELRTPYTPKR